MNNIPKFAAAASLYKMSGSYRSVTTQSYSGGAGAATIAPAASASALSGGRGGFGGLGGFGLGIWCTGRWSCYPCTRCIPFTDYCFESTCCDLVGFDCGF